MTKRFLIMGLLCFSLFLPMSAQARSRTDREFTLFATAGLFVGTFDRFDVFFPIPATNIHHAGNNVHVGLEYVLRNGFGIRPQLTYERVFYTSIGIQQAAKSYLVADILFSKRLIDDPANRWQPYIALGPSVAFSTSGKQAYLKMNGGTLYRLKNNWSLRTEASITTEFEGVRGELNAGINYRF
jgi:hypothetical protein